MAISFDVLLTAGYAAFLVLLAVGLEVFVRFLDRMVRKSKTGGFHYHASMDVWECPQGQYLPLLEVDHHRKVARYRAHPHTCNACAMKPWCTNVDTGREIVQPLSDEPSREIAMFQTVISLMFLLLALALAVIELFQHHTMEEIGILSIVLLCSILIGAKMATTMKNGKRKMEKERNY